MELEIFQSWTYMTTLARLGKIYNVSYNHVINSIDTCVVFGKIWELTLLLLNVLNP
jgi:hypothetical protein